MTSVVLELLRGGGLELSSQKHRVTAATLSPVVWGFSAVGEHGLKVRQDDPVDDRGRWTRSVIVGLAIKYELRRESIRRIKDEKPFLS